MRIVVHLLDTHCNCIHRHYYNSCWAIWPLIFITISSALGHLWSHAVFDITSINSICNNLGQFELERLARFHGTIPKRANNLHDKFGLYTLRQPMFFCSIAKFSEPLWSTHMDSAEIKTLKVILYVRISSVELLNEFLPSIDKLSPTVNWFWWHVLCVICQADIMATSGALKQNIPCLELCTVRVVWKQSGSFLRANMDNYRWI